MSNVDEKVIALLRQDYDRFDAGTQARIDAECDRYLASVGAAARFASTGRKPLPPEQVRNKRVIVSYNEDEYARILAAVDGGALAAQVRELSLKAADAALAERRRSE